MGWQLNGVATAPGHRDTRIAVLAVSPELSDSGASLSSRIPQPEWILTGIVLNWPDGKPAALEQSPWTQTALGWT
jgi:hypothetical protein